MTTPGHELMSCDVSITKSERFDVALARLLKDHPDCKKEDKLILGRMLKGVHHLNQSNATYKLGKHCKQDFLGRWCALHGQGLQCLSRDVRNALGKDFYMI